MLDLLSFSENDSGLEQAVNKPFIDRDLARDQTVADLNGNLSFQL